MLDILQIFSESGPTLGVIAVCVSAVVLFVIRDWKTISKLDSRVLTLENEYRQLSQGMLARCEAALVNSNKILERILDERV